MRALATRLARFSRVTALAAAIGRVGYARSMPGAAPAAASPTPKGTPAVRAPGAVAAVPGVPPPVVPAPLGAPRFQALPTMIVTGPEPLDVDTAERLASTLRYYRRVDDSRRTLTAALLMGTGVGIGLSGAWILSQNAPGSVALGAVALSAGLALTIGGFLPFVRPSEADTLLGQFLGWRWQGMTLGEAALRTEQRWQRLADQARSWRYVAAGIAFTAAAASLAGVATIMLSAAASSRASGGYDAGPFSALAAFALLSGALGVSSLVMESEIESQFHVWRLSQGRASARSRGPRTPGVALRPGGIALSVDGTF